MRHEKRLVDEEEQPNIFDKKCCEKRKVKDCRRCLRYQDCLTGKHFISEDGAIRLVGAMIWSALEDLERPIPPLAKCKTKSQKNSRARILMNKAKAEVFFKTKLFQYAEMDITYLREAYKREKARTTDDETKIPRRRYRGAKVEKH